MRLTQLFVRVRLSLMCIEQLVVRLLESSVSFFKRGTVMQELIVRLFERLVRLPERLVFLLQRRVCLLEGGKLVGSLFHGVLGRNPFLLQNFYLLTESIRFFRPFL